MPDDEELWPAHCGATVTDRDLTFIATRSANRQHRGTGTGVESNRRELKSFSTNALGAQR